MASLPWIQFTDRLVGRGHPTLPDELNAALRQLLSESGYNPDANPLPGLRGPVFNAKAFGAIGDGVTDDSAAIQAAVTAADTSTSAAEVFIPRGNYKLQTSVTVTAATTTISGDGPLTSLQPVTDAAIKVATSNGGIVGPLIRTFAVTPKAAANGKYAIDVLSGLSLFRDVAITNGGFAAGWAGAFRATEVNGLTLDNIRIQGDDTDRWPIGLDICQGATANRGNVTLLGGFINRATIGMRIANGASGVVNNVQLFGTKFLFNGSGAEVGGIGIQSATMRLLGLYGVHLESYDIGIELTQVLGASILNSRLVNFALPLGGSNQIGLSLKTACNQIIVGGNEFDSGTVSTGTCIITDATAHKEITILPNRYAAFATIWTDNGTSGGRMIWSADSSLFNFWFKDKLRANHYLTFPSNVTLGAGNNNNLAQPAGGIWRVTCDAGGSTLTGIAGGVTGDAVRVVNVAGGTLTLTHNDTANSSAVNCFFTPTAGSLTVAANHSVDIWYDASTTRWRPVQALP